ncbi:MAG: hypothetical protein AB1815_14480 [Bacillota bacterium]
MGSKKFAAIIAGVLIISVALGGLGYFVAKLPELRAYNMAQQEQERLENMVHSGTVISVAENELTLKLAGEQKKDEIQKIKVTDYTSIQEGMTFLKEPGEKLDLTQYVQPGNLVQALVEDGEALVLHFQQIDTPHD